MSFGVIFSLSRNSSGAPLDTLTNLLFDFVFEYTLCFTKSQVLRGQVQIELLRVWGPIFLRVHTEIVGSACGGRFYVQIGTLKPTVTSYSIAFSELVTGRFWY